MKSWLPVRLNFLHFMADAELEKFSIDKSYAAQLGHKLETFKQQTGTNKQLFLTMITTHGLVQNEYARELVSREVTLKDLFQ